jgi:hypothetical protein
MKSKWHIPLSSKDPGYQTELARCMFYNKRWDELTDEEKSDKNVPSIFIQRYSKVTKATIGDIAEVIGGNHGGGRKKTGIYGDIPFPAVSMEYKKAMAACRFFKKTWENLTDEERRWDPTLKGTLHHNNNQMIGLPVRSGDTTGKDGCFIGPDGIIDGGKPKIDGMVFDSRLQKVKKNCEDLCWVTDLVTTLVKAQARQVEIIKTMYDTQVTLENSIKSNTRAIEEQTTAIKDLTMTLKNFRGV